MRIESDKSEVNKPAAEVFTFLSNFNNFQKLMPPQVVDWQSTEDDCHFKISGMASIGMKIIEKIPNSLIKVVSNGKVPFAFTMNIHLTEITPTQTSGQLIFEADLNPMMSMMVEKPLRNFFNLLAEKMKEL
ncbi:MAG: SRPBCC family protein [Bacteroidetes bacterium]|nr:MAG: SRPBCC family protein [Bacteroidota bacterium]